MVNAPVERLHATAVEMEQVEPAALRGVIARLTARTPGAPPITLKIVLTTRRAQSIAQEEFSTVTTVLAVYRARNATLSRCLRAYAKLLTTALRAEERPAVAMTAAKPTKAAYRFRDTRSAAQIAARKVKLSAEVPSASAVRLEPAPARVREFLRAFPRPRRLLPRRPLQQLRRHRPVNLPRRPRRDQVLSRRKFCPQPRRDTSI